MFERAIMTRARVLLLDLEHSANRMLRLAMDNGVPSWARKVEAIMNSPKFSACIPEVTSAPGVSEVLVKAARSDKLVRKKILSDYKWSVVRPILWDYDHRAFMLASGVILPGLGMPFSVFAPVLRPVPLELLNQDGSANLWTGYRLWSLVRVSGRWPLPVYRGDQLPVDLPACPLCGMSEVAVDHALCDCTSLGSCLRDLCCEFSLPRPSVARDAFLLALFRDGEAANARVAHCRFVAATIGHIVRVFMSLTPAGTRDSGECAEFSAADSMDASLRRRASATRDYYDPPEPEDCDVSRPCAA